MVEFIVDLLLFHFVALSTIRLLFVITAIFPLTFSPLIAFFSLPIIVAF